MRRTLLLLWCVIGMANDPSALTLSQDASLRPVRDVTEQPKASSIEFVSFDFQQPDLYHALTVHYRPIKGEPSAGADYGVEASLGGQEAIATLLFEVLDEAGTAVQPIPMVHRSIGVPGDLEFIGMLTVPARPFRVRVTGEDIYGRRFSQVFRRLFKPVAERPADEEVPPEFGSEFVQHVQQMFADARAERSALAAGNPSGRIVMPRPRVSNVTYASFVSPSGRSLGIRVTYDVEFSQAGRYNPNLRIHAEDREDTSIGRYPLRPLKNTIQPVPRETYAPYQEAQEISGLLAHRADFLYETGITYRFMLELVPEFVMMHRNSTIPCLVHEGSRYNSAARTAFARMLARNAPTTYRVFIGGTAFEGRIDNFYGEGTFYRSFVAEGLTECERIPENER
jgi:hypothetical protein